MFEFPPELIMTVGGRSMVYIMQTIREQPVQQPASPPVQPPLTNGVLCNCNQPAELQRGRSEKTGKDWARYVCANPPRDPKNCGFKKWID